MALTITKEDNMLLMSRYPDKFFDLAIVDPPYELPKKSTHKRGKLGSRILSQLSNEGWDVRPGSSYFKELFRVSKNQIIWGGNHFINDLRDTRCIICWDKVQPWENFAQIEMAWTSFDGTAKLVRFDNRTGDKIHPTQKHVWLYKWILEKFAKPGFKILDTHLGSGSIAIACHDYGFDLVACDTSEKHYNDAMERINTHISQVRMF